jgi:FixJ family two-component response regulator
MMIPFGKLQEDLCDRWTLQSNSSAPQRNFGKSSRLQEVSCLVLDVRLPGMSGLQLQRHLAQRGYRIPIIFVTACLDEGLRPRALNAGAVDFLPKPFTEQALLKGFDLPWG